MAYTISKDSPLLRFVRFFEHASYEPTDVCSYVRAVLKASLLSIVSVVLLAMLTVVLTCPIWIAVVGYFTGKAMFSMASAISIFLWVWMGAAVVWTKWKQKRDERKFFGVEKEPGLIGTWYTSFKEKTCILVKVE